MAIDRNQAPEGAGQEDRTEELILTIPRGRLDELRIVRVIHEGKPSLLLRAWVIDPKTGGWIPAKRGISIRVKELAPVAEALIEALPWAAAIWAEKQRVRS